MVDASPTIADQWLPVARAAPLLGLTERTLRRRVDDGEYETRASRHGLLVRVPAVSVNGRGEAPALSDDGAGAPPESEDGSAAPAPAGIATAAITAMAQLVERERERSAELERRASQAEQAATMWQERCRNVESELERVLALPAHEEEPPRRRWWRFWR